LALNLNSFISDEQSLIFWRKKPMVFGPTPMRRLYLAVPIEYEDQVLTKIGELGTVQLIREFQVKRAEKSKFVDIKNRFERLNEKLYAVLPRETARKLALPTGEVPAQEDLVEVEKSLTQNEMELDNLIGRLERLEREVKERTVLREKLNYLVQIGLRTDEVGIFTHLFVKIGFLRSPSAARLVTYTSGTSIISSSFPGRPRENLVIIAGLNDDRPFAEQTLKLLNFEEITLPKDLNPDPKLALEETENAVKLGEKEIAEVMEKVAKIMVKTVTLTPYVNEAVQYEEAKERLIRTKKKSLIHGWIPFSKVDAFRTQIEQVVPKESVYLNIEKPKPEDTVPVQYTSKGIVKAFELFTFLQGVPNYFEVNPTPIYSLLYVLMFGMMFGDVGAGIVLMVLGLLITRLRKGLFAFSISATKKIARIMIGCGFLTTVFGFVYGVFFLVRTPWPYLFSPLIDLQEIMIIALGFGVAQIILSLILNIVNMVRKKRPLESILGERGIIALLFYVSGVVAGYTFIVEKRLEVFFQGITAIFSSIALASLALIFLSPLIESLLEHDETPILVKLLEGFGKGLEAFIAFIANSVSYIRLAAFAIAHEAIGVAAVVLGTVFGSVLSLILLNVLDFSVEGFASFIQSLRLMYYEFSTRFFLKTGIAYEPFKVSHVKIKI
jgi:vacuolar-type H+-ATPase subunit I/STV1